MRFKKKLMRVKKSASVKKFMRFTRTTRARAIFFVVIGVMGGAMMLIAAGRSSQKGPGNNVATAHVRPDTMTAAQVETRKPTVSTAAVASGVIVTITGCLELDDQTFRLKDTTGTDAPKARSWKSAFLKKGSASIDVVDAANKVKLPNHVGERVTVTGKLTDRELQVRSLQRVAASCSAKSGVKV